MRTQKEMQYYMSRNWPKQRGLVEPPPGPVPFVPSKEALARCKKNAQERRYHEWQQARKDGFRQQLHWPYPWFYEEEQC